MKMSFWRVLGFFNAVSEWAVSALVPDEDGVARITVPEMTDLIKKMCAAFGWKAEIVVGEE